MHPSPPIPSAPDARPQFAVLVVGGSNICRSAAAERLLGARLGHGSRVAVTSAGVNAALERPVPQPMVELLASAGAPVDGHAARQVDTEMLQAADLILTASRQERVDVVRRVPAAVRRTFTVRELARVATHLDPSALPDGDVAARFSALAAAAGPLRADTLPPAPADDDLLDPYGLDERAYAVSFDQVRAAVDGIVLAVRPGPVPGEPDPPRPELVVPPVRPRRRTRSVALVVLASILGLAVAVAVGAVVAVDRLDARIRRFPDPFADLPTRPAPAVPESDVPSARQPVTVLVLGSTDDVATADPADWESAAALTDVVMLARVSADRESAQVVVLPPDLSVEVPGSGPGTLRFALARGGPSLAVQTVEQLTNVRMDHVALTDAGTFARVTEALGGVDFTLASDLVVDGRVLAAAGQRRLSGEAALHWMNGTGEGDDGRPERARAWLSAILERLGDGDVRRDPTTWPQLIGVVSGSVAVDEGFDRATMLGLLTSLRNLRPGDVDVVTAPTRAEPAPGGGAAVVSPDPGPFDDLMDALRTDTLSAQLAAQGATD